MYTLQVWFKHKVKCMFALMSFSCQFYNNECVSQVLVFPPLEIVPGQARVPPGARLQLRARGGPPPHLAALHYRATHGLQHVDVRDLSYY